MKNGGDPKNPLLSPLSAKDEILAQFPPTRIICCEIDPVRDHSFAFALRLKKLGRDVKNYMLKDQMHGSCSYDMKKFGISECHSITVKTIKIMRKFFNLPKK